MALVPEGNAPLSAAGGAPETFSAEGCVSPPSGTHSLIGAEHADTSTASQKLHRITRMLRECRLLQRVGLESDVWSKLSTIALGILRRGAMNGHWLIRLGALRCRET